jgi:hypothetical protein
MRYALRCALVPSSHTRIAGPNLRRLLMDAYGRCGSLTTRRLRLLMGGARLYSHHRYHGQLFYASHAHHHHHHCRLPLPMDGTHGVVCGRIAWPTSGGTHARVGTALGSQLTLFSLVGGNVSWVEVGRPLPRVSPTHECLPFPLRAIASVQNPLVRVHARRDNISGLALWFTVRIIHEVNDFSCRKIFGYEISHVFQRKNCPYQLEHH